MMTILLILRFYNVDADTMDGRLEDGGVRENREHGKVLNCLKGPTISEGLL